MKFKSALMTQGSGSVGGITLSHNAGGMYFRARAIPVNPGTPQQEAVRADVLDLSNRWVNSLTNAQRELWNVYAANVAMPGRLGDPIFLSGLNHYVRSNVPRLQGVDPRVNSGPTIFDVGGFTAPSFALDEPNEEVDITFDNTDEWANEDDASLLVYASRPQNPTINYFKGPYRFAGQIEGDVAVPPVSPAAIPLPFAVAPGQRVFFKVSVTRVDGRLSSSFRDQADI